jgi:hypothetical protein
VTWQEREREPRHADRERLAASRRRSS